MTSVVVNLVPPCVVGDRKSLVLEVSVSDVSRFLNYYLRVCNVEFGEDRPIKIIALSDHLACPLSHSLFSVILVLCEPQGCLYLFYLVLLTLLLDFLASANSCKEKASLRCCLLNAIAP